MNGTSINGMKSKFNKTKYIPDKYCLTVLGMNAPVNINSISIWNKCKIDQIPTIDLMLIIDIVATRPIVKPIKICVAI